MGCCCNAAIGDRLRRIEEVLSSLVERLDRRSESDDALAMLTAGLAAYRRRVLDEQAIRRDRLERALVLDQVARDSRLRFAHRRIVERLLEQRDLETGAFAPVSFSQLVRRAKVGKSRAKTYLADLEASGLIARRADGYRTWFSLSSRLEASS